MVAELATPTMAVQRSWLEALEEYHQEGRYAELDVRGLRDADEFRRYVEAVRAEALPETPRRHGTVPQTTRWLVKDGQYLGRVSVRHHLNEQLRRVGGHIGYDVRPSARGQGYGTMLLALALPVARDLGIDLALVTCDVTNTRSRRVVEGNGGRPAGQDTGTLHFWVPTAASPSAGTLGDPPP